jgi:hypothetical protein
MDIKKVIANSAYVFDEFATILKERKRPGCKLSDMDIDFICEQYKFCLLLWWDGAFSAARSINPTDRDFRYCMNNLSKLQYIMSYEIGLFSNPQGPSNALSR